LIAWLESNPGDDDCSGFKPPLHDTELEQITHSRIFGWSSVVQATSAPSIGADLTEFGQAPKRFFSESPTVTETPLQPNMAERAIDTATDVSRTINDVSVALQAAVDRLTEAIRTARQPGMPLSTLSAITREAPLASLFVAFLFGVAVARRR
jgi:hypothetical protein